ncbi:hypothetical protein [Actinoallomurus sp. NPDC050550]|uniref:hypothetical protein n=1 Tax=Actinoallomurus sp. NPDC050550 TaxID=3154937 RepID=UPI0033D8AEEB
MKVTADQVTSLKAYLRGDTASFERINAQLDPTNKRARGALIAAAFYSAAERAFADGKRSDVIEFVGRARARSERLAEAIDPRVAERLLLATFTDEDIDDISGETQGDHFGLLLAGMIAEAQLSDAELDAFLDDASKLADSWLG